MIGEIYAWFPVDQTLITNRYCTLLSYILFIKAVNYRALYTTLYMNYKNFNKQS